MYLSSVRVRRKDAQTASLIRMYLIAKGSSLWLTRPLAPTAKTWSYFSISRTCLLITNVAH